MAPSQDTYETSDREDPWPPLHPCVVNMSCRSGSGELTTRFSAPIRTGLDVEEGCYSTDVSSTVMLTLGLQYSLECVVRFVLTP